MDASSECELDAFGGTLRVNRVKVLTDRPTSTSPSVKIFRIERDQTGKFGVFSCRVSP